MLLILGKVWEKEGLRESEARDPNPGLVGLGELGDFLELSVTKRLSEGWVASMESRGERQNWQIVNP